MITLAIILILSISSLFNLEVINSRYVTLELQDKMIMLPGYKEPIPIIIGNMIWGEYTIRLFMLGDKPAGEMVNSDGTVKYPLSQSEAATMIMMLNDLDSYFKASEDWFKGGGKYKKHGELSALAN